MEFKAPGKAANKDDWNKFLMATKVETGERELKLSDSVVFKVRKNECFHLVLGFSQR